MRWHFRVASCNHLCACQASQGQPEMSIGLPLAQGLYDPRYEHDSCGVGFIVDLKGRKSHQYCP